MKEKEIQINKILIYTVLILMCLRTTLIYNNNVFYKMLPIVVCFSFGLIVLNYKKFNLKQLRESYLIILYLIIRVISLCISEEKISNLKNFIYEVFFLIIVLQLFIHKESTTINISKILIVINIILNIISLIYQYIFQRDFNRELFGVYTNPNGLANYTMICIIMYISFIMKSKTKVISLIYLLFSVVIILLSESRTSIICLVIYGVLKIILDKGILELNIIKKLFIIGLIIVLTSIISVIYINRGNIYSTELEEKINDITTNRYYLWKYSIISLEKQPIFGIGESNIGKYRIDNINDEIINNMPSTSRVNMLSSNNNHNGYIQLLVSNGWLCFIIYMIILIKKINNVNKNDFLIIAIILISNLFENILLLSQSINIFLLMYLLNQRVEIRDKKELTKNEGIL